MSIASVCPMGPAHGATQEDLEQIVALTQTWPPIVVTGMGLVTPVGIGVERVWENLMACKSATRLIDRFDASEFAVQFACQVDDFDPLDWMEYRDARRFDRVVQFAIATAQQAVDQAGLDITSSNADRVGVVIGTGIGGLETIQEGFETLVAKGPMRVNPLTGAMMLPDMPSGQVAISFGARGPNFCVVSACATGSNAIGEAAEIIRRGDADVMLAGSTEACITPFALSAFHRTGAMSTRNDDPAHASRPFDGLRDGFVFGEGAGLLVLESLEHALGRGARPLAMVAGYATTADAFHVSAPLEDGSGAAAAMSRALAKGGIDPSEIDYINAHGTGTPLNDASETRAIKTVFGQGAYSIPVSSTKSMHGHLMGAAGSVEAAITVLTIRRRVLPPTINYEVPDPDCDLDYVPNTPRAVGRVRFALSNSFGFGGHNACVAFKEYADDT
jgi:3-oxoacyl-[acyl-carrier-protein] synthase II